MAKFGLLSRLFSGATKRGNITSRADEPDVLSVTNDDEAMNWAIEKAQLTLDYFITSLSEHIDAANYVSVKARIQDGEHIEHIWITDPEFDIDGNLFGTIGNEPLNVKNVRLGQRVGIDRSQITDWMIVDQGRLIGGYTIRAIRDKIVDKNDLKRFDKELGNVLIDEGEDYFLANFETPEGAILCLENAYNEGNLETVLGCMDFFEEAKLMLHKKGLLEKINEEEKKEMIESIAEILELSVIKGVQKDGMPDFSNCKRAFPVREKLSPVHWIITEVVYHPDGTKSTQRINTYLTESGWKVLGPE